MKPASNYLNYMRCRAGVCFSLAYYYAKPCIPIKAGCLPGTGAYILYIHHLHEDELVLGMVKGASLIRLG